MTFTHMISIDSNHVARKEGDVIRTYAHVPFAGQEYWCTRAGDKIEIWQFGYSFGLDEYSTWKEEAVTDKLEPDLKKAIIQKWAEMKLEI